MAQRRITSTESPGMDWLDGLISIVGVVSTVSDAAPVPWVSAATEVVLNILKRVKSSVQNAEDLKDLAYTIVDFVTLLRESTIRHTDILLDSAYENPFQQTCLEFTNTLTTILNEMNAMKNRDKNWLKKYLKAGSIGRKIDKYKEALGHIQNQLTARAALQTGLYLPRIGDDISRHRAESLEYFQELQSHFVGNRYRGQFRIIKRGDLQLIRQHAVNREYVVEIQTTGVVSTQKLTKRQRRHRRFHGNTHVNLKESVECIDSVAVIYGERNERVVRQYRGPECQARFKQDLNLYEKLMHPNITQVFGVIPEIHSIVFHGDETIPLYQYLGKLSSPIDKFIAECRIAEELSSLREYCRTNLYFVEMFWELIPISRYTEHVSLTFGQTGEITVANEDCSYPEFIVHGLFGDQCLQIPSIEISNLFNKKRSLPHVRPLSLLPTLYHAMEAIENPVWSWFQYIQLGAKPYKTSILGLGCVYRIIPDGFEKIAQPPLCHGSDTNSRQRIRFRWEKYGRWMPQCRGWTRCEVSCPHDLRLTAHPVRELKLRTDIFFSQVHRLALLSGFHEANIRYVKEIYFAIKFQSMRHRVDTPESLGLAGTFMSENDNDMDRRTKEKAYIFIRDMEVDISDDMSVLTTPEMYWASDPEGVVRWTEEELTEYLATWDLQTDDLRLEELSFSYRWDNEHLDVLREAHRLCGFDPDSDEMAKALGYPILEVKPTFMPGRIMAPRPDSEENEEVDHTEPGSNVDTRPGTEKLQSSIVEVDDAASTPAPMDQLSPENASSNSPCVPDNHSGVTKQVDQGMALENAREPVESKQGADSSNHPIAEDVYEHNIARTSNEASTAQCPLESCHRRDDDAGAIVDDQVTHSEIHSSTSVSPTMEECPLPVASIEEVSASKMYSATEQICQSEIQASACRKLFKTLCLVFPPTFILGILIGILFTLAYHSPYFVIAKISVHVEF